MKRYSSLIFILTLCILLAPRMQAQPKAEGDPSNKASVLIISLISKEISNKIIKLRYEIRNGSEHDIWICEAISTWGFEAYLAEDGQTLLIRRRLDVPIYSFRNQPFGRYVYLQAGKSWRECLTLPLPVHLRGVFSNGTPTTDIVYAKRLALEVGYYAEDLPGMVRGILEEAEKISGESAESNFALIKKNIKGLLYFNEANEGLRNRDEQVLIAYSHQALKGEQVLRTMIDDLSIPYIGIPQRPKLTPPDLSRCTRIEILYQPSMLQYFFPNTGDRAILSAVEMEYLHSLKALTVDNQRYIKDFSSELSKGFPGGISTERSTANVICYRDGERLTSFCVYDDASIVTEGRQLFTYRKGLRKGLRSLRILTPQIQPFELRVQCAANLKDLWHRLRLYYKVEKRRLKDSDGKSKIVYPAPPKWCDAMVRAYRTIGMLDENIMRPHMCPSAGEDKYHYAMNPNCKPDSPPDMVLLFETKAGWNQHGGPELFTFDNHDPKGGCVLLNDGTVKFIRTKEELQKLRWK